MNDQKRAEAFIDEHGLGGDVSTWVHDLQSELGEVSKEVLRATDYGENDPEFGEAVEAELGDLYFSLLGLANALGVELGAALDGALDKYGDRVDETGGAGSWD